MRPSGHYVGFVMSGKRGAYVPGRERRERILDAAAARFSRDGYSRVALADIARDAGVTAPGLKHHFASKELLLVGLAERRFAGALATAAAVPPDGDGTGTLRLMLRQTELRVSQPELIQVFIQVAGLAADPSSTAHRLFAERYERVIRDLQGRFMGAVEAGLLRPDLDYAAVARDFIAVSDGLQLQWVLSGGAVDMVGLMRAHLERLAPEILVTGKHVDLSSPDDSADR